MTHEAKTLTIDQRFEYAINFVLAHEGGYSNDLAEGEIESKFGISKKSYPHLNIPALTLTEAKAIYKRDFWDPHPYKDIPNIVLATKIFDMTVNMGFYWAYRLVQRALRAMGQKVVEDGILGPRTLMAIMYVDMNSLLAALRSECAGYYRTLVALQPARMRFLKGWLRRAYA